MIPAASLPALAVDIAIGATLLEGFALLALYLLKGKGPAPRDWLGNLLAGLFLMVALRSALAGPEWPLLAGCLVGSLVAHCADLVRRWPR
jgi:hypothetical protein